VKYLIAHDADRGPISPPDPLTLHDRLIVGLGSQGARLLMDEIANLRQRLEVLERRLEGEGTPKP
jgi:hypothetical protein